MARGDLSKKITVDVRREILELKNTINTMVDQLNSFASEVTRVVREVGTEGNLGGDALASPWRDGFPNGCTGRRPCRLRRPLELDR